MKSIFFVCALFAMGFVNSCFAQDINGKWKAQMEGPNGSMDMVFTFKVNADTLTGTVESPMGELPISNGKVSGHQFSFDVSFNEMTMSHQCTIAGDSISMKVPGMQGDAMEMTLRRFAESK
jgi:hypothetical protein